MTYKQYTVAHQGKFIDMNGYPKDNPFQCMDNMRIYFKEVLGLPYYALPAVSYAKQVFKNMSSAGDKNFIKIKNTPTGVPKQGDIMFWDGPVIGVTGLAGHVAIFDMGDVNSFVSYDQNYGTGTPCHFQRHNYRGVMGWLRKR